MADDDSPTPDEEPVQSSKRGWWVIGGMCLLALVGSLLPDDEADSDYSPHSSDSEYPPPSFGSDDYCIEEADRLLRDYPGVYASRQEAYDGCRNAGDIVDELRGEVDRRP